jgi:hypothetical protein
MQPAAKILSLIALGLTIVPPAMFMFHSLAESMMKALMIAGCILWFVVSPFSMKGGSE